MLNEYFDQLKEWFIDNEIENQEMFFNFLRFPSISADSAYHNDMLSCANWLIDFSKSFNLEAQLIETPSYPIVFAEKHISDNLPTVLIYGHYDVQPIDPIKLWVSNPFEPRLEGDKIYARGSVDNKGQIFYCLLLFKALHELKILPSVNIKFCIEGEEESSSKGLSAILTDKAKLKKLSCDYLLVVDVDIPEENTPAITLGSRGIVPLNIEVIGANTDLHSGHHGGVAYNPIRALIEMLSKLWKEDGSIAIDNFYDDVDEIKASELDFSFDEKQYMENFGIRACVFEKNLTPLESNWLRPSIEINGIYGGYSGEGFKTIIPAVANAKLSCRIVSSQTPEKVGTSIIKFLKENIPKGMEIKIEVLHGGYPLKADINSLITKCALNAYSRVFNKPCKKIMTGGSIPVIAELKNALNCDCVLMGMGLAEDNIHAPNEHFSWKRLEKGFYVIGMIMKEMENRPKNIKT
jgi:acetylornithine deacetylase/succinyl-diaminopimelate desuccinylase-like protein